jgi:hypothetical protein
MTLMSGWAVPTVAAGEVIQSGMAVDPSAMS